MGSMTSKNKPAEPERSIWTLVLLIAAVAALAVLVGTYLVSQRQSSSAASRAPLIDGIPCNAENVTYHVHAALLLIDRGKLQTAPANTGIVDDTCLYWLHTHDGAGTVHVESPQTSSPAGGPFTFGMLFDIWGQPLLSNQVGKFKGPVTAYVNGAKYTGELRAIPLLAHQQVTLEIGKFVPPQNYAFPPED